MKNKIYERRQGEDRREKPRHHFSVGGGERRVLGVAVVKNEVQWQEISPYWPQAV